jgi:uncharacterized membrane protein YqaE (UPF0057 family)
VNIFCKQPKSSTPPLYSHANVNILKVPPIAVMMLTGLGHDTLVNSLLFLAGVLPSHVHGFYISCTYFHRRRKARKGRYPGGRKGMIASKNVLNGGLRLAEVERRWLAENGGESEKLSRRRLSRASKRQSRRSSRRSSWRDEEYKEFASEVGGRDNINQRQAEMDMVHARPQSHRIQTWRSEVADTDVDITPALPPRPGVG